MRPNPIPRHLQEGDGNLAEERRTWFDTCPGRPATKFGNIYQYLDGEPRPGFEPGPWRSHQARGYLISHIQPDMPAKIDFVGVIGSSRDDQAYFARPWPHWSDG